MKFLTFALLWGSAYGIAQESIKEIKAEEIYLLNLSLEGELQFKKDKALFAEIANKLENGVKPEDLSENEQRVWNETDETIEDYWEAIGGGCSWYCGGGPREVTASSILKPQGTNTYGGNNAHDLSFKTAWVEGVAGYGVGEYLLYKFEAESPRITDVIVVNGYVKSERAYLDNSRVKKLKMYVNNKPYAVLYLEDRRSQQVFKFKPIGNSDRENLNALKLQPGWVLKFEILEVYPGLKYDDVAISEIYFDGIDVH